MRHLSVLCLISVLLLAVACGDSQKEESASNTEDSAVSTLVNGSFTAEINGRTMHYQVHGSGPACIVLTNAWGFDSVGVRVLFRPLEEMLTMVYFDPRGMGQSGPVVEDMDMSMDAVREDAHALFQYLGLESAVFAGWSNGAGNLLLYAAEYPEDVNAAIVLHGAAFVTPEAWQEIMKKYPELIQANAALEEELSSDDVPLEEKTARMKEFSLSRFFPEMTADPEIAKENFPMLFADADFSYKHNQYISKSVFDFDARDELAQISAPTLVIAGAHDMMTTDMVKEIADGIDGAQFVVFENSGHFAPLEETVRFVEVVREFLASVQ